MKQRNILQLILVLFIVGASVTVNAHSEIPLDYVQILKKSKIVAIGIIIRKEEDKSRCEHTKRYFIKPLSFLKGTLKNKTPLTFTRTSFFWRRARWPWQEDCHSVHYTIAPQAKIMTVGTKVIATIIYSKRLKRFAITSTKEIEKLDYVKKIIESEGK